VLEQDQIDNLWVTVRMDLFGTKESFVPLADASGSGDRISVQYDKAFVKDAPNIDEEDRYRRADGQEECGRGRSASADRHGTKCQERRRGN
jgi:hypothetical protein